MYDATLQRNKKNKPREWFNGNLLVAQVGAISKIPFNYGKVTDRSYTETVASLPINFVAVTEQIYTTRIDLPFSSGSKIELHDKQIMTVENVGSDIDEHKALMGLDGLVGYYITLNGGGR